MKVFRLAQKNTRTLSHGVGILIVGVLIGLTGAAVPAYTTLIFDHIVRADHQEALLLAVLTMLAIVSLLHCFDFFAAILRLRLQTWVSHSFNSGAMERLLSLPTAFFRRFSVGETLTRSGIADMERERLLISAFDGVLSGLLSAPSLLVLFWLDTSVGLVSSAAGGLVFAVTMLSFFGKIRLERDLNEKKSRIHSFLLQVLAGHSKIRAAGAEERVFSRWALLFHQRQRLGLDSSRIENHTAVLHSLLPGASLTSFFLLLGMGIAVDSSDLRDPTGLSPGRYVATFASLTLFLNGMFRVSSALMDLARAVPLLERTKPLFLTPPEQDYSGKRSHVPSGRIEAKNLSFRFAPESPFILENLNFQIETGQFVAVVGASGSGKSTLMRLLLGFDTPTLGELFYDGIPQSELDLSGLRRQIGTILQHDNLLSGNIFDNIAAARPISLAEAWEAARIAGFSQDLAKMPMGMHSFVTQGGGAFSGGERQRIMIARAVAGKPRILLLDEATSALDNQVQAEVIRNLEELRVTRVLVAHRLSTVIHADLILVLDRGRLVESGDFDSLMAKNGIFAQLARRQGAGRVSGPPKCKNRSQFSTETKSTSNPY